MRDWGWMEEVCRGLLRIQREMAAFVFTTDMTTNVRDETNVSTTDLGALFTGEPVVVAYLFGSQARGDAGPLSDVDVAILLEGDLSPGEALSLRLRLMEAIGRALCVERVDVVVLNGAPHLLQHRVIRDGRVLFCRDELARVRYEFRVLRDYLDFRYFEDKYFQAVEGRILREGLGARHRGHPKATGQTHPVVRNDGLNWMEVKRCDK